MEEDVQECTDRQGLKLGLRKGWVQSKQTGEAEGGGEMGRELRQKEQWERSLTDGEQQQNLG